MTEPRGGFAIESTLDVELPPDEVFDVLADAGSFKAVDAALIEIEPEGPLVAGMTGRFLHRRGGSPREPRGD